MYSYSYLICFEFTVLSTSLISVSAKVTKKTGKSFEYLFLFISYFVNKIPNFHKFHLIVSIASCI